MSISLIWLGLPRPGIGGRGAWHISKGDPFVGASSRCYGNLQLSYLNTGVTIVLLAETVGAETCCFSIFVNRLPFLKSVLI